MGCAPSVVGISDEQRAATLLRDLEATNKDVNHKKTLQMRKAFNYADKDQSGSIDFDEFMTSMKIKDGPLAKSLWKHYDIDNDKSIDFTEFVTRLSESLAIKSMGDRADWAFELYDLDRDGNLALGEIEKSLNDPNVNIPWTRSQLEAIFSDRSVKSDSVSKEEFCKVAKTCSTLIFPAFIMLDTVKAKVFEYESRKNLTKKDMSQDLARAMREKAVLSGGRDRPQGKTSALGAGGQAVRAAERMARTGKKPLPRQY